MGEQTHNGSKKNLLGPQPTSDDIELFSNERQVTDATPPAFLAHAKDDKPVPPGKQSCMPPCAAWPRVAQYLEQPAGGHGLNGYKGPMWDAWQTGSLQWLAGLGVIPASDATE